MRVEIKSLPIVKADIKEKLSIVDITIANSETAKIPWSIGGNIVFDNSRYGLPAMLSGSMASAYRPAAIVIKSNRNQKIIDI